MPIEKAMSDAMLGTFRQMVKDCTDKGYSGEAFDTMIRMMNEMNQLATTMNDFTTFSTKLTTGGYFMSFSNAYAQVLANAATATYATATYNDDALLQQTIQAYKESLIKYEKHPDKTRLTKAVQDIIDIGTSGVNYPTFLRLLIEQGLDKALEGMIVNRANLEADVQFNDDLLFPPMQRRSKAILQKFDELSAQSKSGIMNTTIFFLEQSKITDDTEADLRSYQHIQTLWFNMITQLHTWIDAYTKFAATDERFAGASAAEAHSNIEKSKQQLPGKIKVYESQLLKNYELTWPDIFTSESFKAETKSKRFNYTGNYISFLKEDVYAQCLPHQSANSQLIQKAELLYGHALQ